MNKLVENYEKWNNRESISVIHKKPTGQPYVVAKVWVEKSLSTDDKLEQAFMLTNSIDDAWWNNKEVDALHKTRSTSVGDQVLIGIDKYECLMRGWKKL